MDYKATFKKLIAWVFGILFICTVVSLLLMFFKGMGWVADVVLPFLNEILSYMYGVSVFVLVPLALVRRVRIISVFGLGITFQVSFIYLWLTSMAVTYSFWGTIGVVFGIFLSVVGVIPLGFIAAISNGAWPATIGLAFLFGECVLAGVATAWIASKLD